MLVAICNFKPTPAESPEISLSPDEVHATTSAITKPDFFRLKHASLDEISHMPSRAVEQSRRLLDSVIDLAVRLALWRLD